MELYLNNGFLNIPAVDAYADKHGVAYILIIGKRQVGKTYGVLKLELDTGRKWIFMRRTAKELSLIKKQVCSPFEALEGYEGSIYFEGSADDSILDMVKQTGEEREQVGIAVALSTVASIRGFSGKAYTDLVYDECIPESHVYKIPYEDEAFNNAYVTINGNRELKGEHPLKCWLLANSNKLDCAILKALNLVDIVEKMSKTGEEMRLLKDRRILIIMPDSAKITELRAQTAIYSATGTESDFARMSLENEFSHNDKSDVRQVDIRQYTRLFAVDGLVVCKHKSEPLIYVCELFGDGLLECYTNTEYYRNIIRRKYAGVRASYIRGNMYFQSISVKTRFLDIILN